MGEVSCLFWLSATVWKKTVCTTVFCLMFSVCYISLHVLWRHCWIQQNDAENDYVEPKRHVWEPELLGNEKLQAQKVKKKKKNQR